MWNVGQGHYQDQGQNYHRISPAVKPEDLCRRHFSCHYHRPRHLSDSPPQHYHLSLYRKLHNRRSLPASSSPRGRCDACAMTTSCQYPAFTATTAAAEADDGNIANGNCCWSVDVLEDSVQKKMTELQRSLRSSKYKPQERVATFQLTSFFAGFRHLSVCDASVQWLNGARYANRLNWPHAKCPS